MCATGKSIVRETVWTLDYRFTVQISLSSFMRLEFAYKKISLRRIVHLFHASSRRIKL